VLSLLLPVLLPGLARWTMLHASSGAARGSLVLFTFGLATLAGAQFPLATAVESSRSNPAARLYTADFIGAFIGALATSIWLLPVAGTNAVCWVAASLNLIAALSIFRFKRSP